MGKKIRNVVLALIITVFSIVNVTPGVKAAQSTKAFDTVLVLDVSGSMTSELDEMCDSAYDLCEDILEANSENMIAVVSFETYAQVVCDLTNDKDTLYDAIFSLSCGNTTAMYYGLSYAYEILDSDSSKNDIKNIVVMADGVPNEAPYMENGRYNSMFPDLVYTYDYELTSGNQVYDFAVNILHPEVSVYSVGYFDFDENDWDNLEEIDKFAVQLMKDIANADSFFPDDASAMFDDVGSQLLSEPESEESTGLLTEEYSVIVDGGSTGGGLGTGVKVAIGAVSIGGVGGLIALVIYLVTRTPKPPVPPVMAPVILPMSDDDDDDNNANEVYRTPEGISKFANEADSHSLFDNSFVNNATVYGVSGPYRGASFSISDMETLFIGRDPRSCHIIISDDVSRVSRTHCKIQYNSSRNSFVVTDLSKNGTFTKTSKLPHNVPTELPYGTEIQLADSTNIFRLG